MKNLTLELTKTEYTVLVDAIITQTGYCRNTLNECGVILSKHTKCEVLVEGDFRYFLNECINTIEKEQKASDYIDCLVIDKLCELQSILYKLDQALISLYK